MKKRLLFFIVLMSAAFSVQAQELQSNAWNAWYTDYSITASTTLRLETHFRTRDFTVPATKSYSPWASYKQPLAQV